MGPLSITAGVSEYRFA